MGCSKILSALLLAAVLPVAGGDVFHTKLPKDRKILQALSRLTWGPRPGDPESVKQLGLDKWIDRQLHPSTITESSELKARLEPLETLGMTTAEMVQAYPPPQYIVAVAQGRMPPPVDPDLRAIVEQLSQRYKRRMEAKDGGGDMSSTSGKGPLRASLRDVMEPGELQAVRKGTIQERLDTIAALPPERLLEVLEAMPRDLRRPLFAVAPAELRRKMLRYTVPHEVIAQDLVESKLLHAIYSERQLEDVLTDFWFNHFNVFLDKGADRYLVTAYERDAIRPHVLGKFHDLLLATAEHPAMLFYLDNWQSVDPKAGRGKRGLNENYARELLELHTLGVDGGYTQKDVTEVARCFTGWTIPQPFRQARFEFNARLHDNGEKTVLGVTIPAGGGRQDGLKVLEILSRRPATARFISTQLAQRFVADAPPRALVQRMSETFLKKDGDLREVMKTMLRSPEFWSEGAWRAKVKSPLEMAVSAVRASGAQVDSTFVLGQKIGELGQPLYRKQEPTGYPNTGEDWVNSASLLGRMNFALALTGNRLPGISPNTSLAGNPRQMANALLFIEPSPETLAAIEAGLKEKEDVRRSRVAGLVLGSPDFQRR